MDSERASLAGCSEARFGVVLNELRERRPRLGAEPLAQLRCLLFRLSAVPSAKGLLNAVPVLVFALIVEDASFLADRTRSVPRIGARSSLIQRSRATNRGGVVRPIYDRLLPKNGRFYDHSPQIRGREKRSGAERETERHIGKSILSAAERQNEECARGGT